MRIASLALTVSLLVLSGCGGQVKDISKNDYPVYHKTKVELAKDKDGSGGRVRSLVYNEDQTRLVAAENQYGDGVTEYEQYRDDGTLREVNGFYPLAENAKHRRLKRTVLFDKNGKTVLFERVLRPDGTVESYNRSRPDGGFESETLYADGKTTKTHKLVSASGDVTLEESYRQNGRLEQQTRKVGYGETEITEYRENGLRSSVTTRGANRWSPVEKIVFDSAGVIVEQKVRYTSNSVEVEYRRPDGTLAEKRSYSSYSGVTITSYGEDGKPRYRQEWRGSRSSDDWTDMSKLRVTEVDELKPDGTVLREIEFHDDGKTVKKIHVRDGGYYSGTYRYFRPDGTLEKEEVKESYDKVKETKEFKPEDNIRETVPEEYLKLSPRPHPKMLSVMPEEEPYNPYGEGNPYGEYPYGPNYPFDPNGRP